MEYILYFPVKTNHFWALRAPVIRAHKIVHKSLLSSWKLETNTGKKKRIFQTLINAGPKQLLKRRTQSKVRDYTLSQIKTMKKVPKVFWSENNRTLNCTKPWRRYVSYLCEAPGEPNVKCTWQPQEKAPSYTNEKTIELLTVASKTVKKSIVLTLWCFIDTI